MYLHNAYSPEYKYKRSYDSLIATRTHKEYVIFAPKKKKEMKQHNWQIIVKEGKKFKNPY